MVPPNSYDSCSWRRCPIECAQSATLERQAIFIGAMACSFSFHRSHLRHDRYPTTQAPTAHLPLAPFQMS